MDSGSRLPSLTALFFLIFSAKEQDAKCEPKTDIAFIKTHKTGGTTVMQILHRLGYLRNSSFLLPQTDINNLYPYGLFNPKLYLPPIQHGHGILTHHTVYNRPAITKHLSENSTFFTIIREPLSHLKSTFSFYRLSRLMDDYESTDMEAMLTFLANPGRYDTTFNTKSPGRPVSFTRNPMALELGFPVHKLQNTTANPSSEDIKNFLQSLSRELDLVMVMEYFEESLVLLRRLMCWDLRDILYLKYNSYEYGNVTVPPGLVDKHKRWDSVDYALYEHFNRTLWEKIQKEGSDFTQELDHFRVVENKVRTHCTSPKDKLPTTVEGSPWNTQFQIDSALCTWLKTSHMCYWTLLRDRSLKFHISTDQRKTPPLRKKPDLFYVKLSRKLRVSSGIHSPPFCLLCGEVQKYCSDHEYVSHLYQEGHISSLQSSSNRLELQGGWHGGDPLPPA
ncbi:PREDICTED: galactose-3-O-sulfotransferase 2-like [Branchiostoma belcheri]|uniref:Galactose-3-O-sulfotransferase 2-like n=1 Tax=Branchiostoma belcheri TaxID=7741 RepID=A0A6P4YHK8_BRABE|nr:PREDICTED: galactose-3-O-sulfotransferase 2-like [Branchiostoma belcheri]